mgnify:CR=1 FL=1
MTASTAQQGIADEAEKLVTQGVDPEEAIATAKQTFMDRLRKLGAEGRGGQAQPRLHRGATTMKKDG